MERPDTFPLSHVALSVRWALHAASAVDETRDVGDTSSETEAIAHGLAISAAATLVAAARYLAPADLAAIRNGWLAPRLRAQALVWRSGDAAGAPVCTVREHARVPSGERLPLDTISALFHADLVLTARVDPEASKARVTCGETDLRDRGWTTGGRGDQTSLTERLTCAGLRVRVLPGRRRHRPRRPGSEDAERAAASLVASFEAAART